MREGKAKGMEVGVRLNLLSQRGRSGQCFLVSRGGKEVDLKGWLTDLDLVVLSLVDSTPGIEHMFSLACLTQWGKKDAKIQKSVKGE
jgi:hypothetical protein